MGREKDGRRREGWEVQTSRNDGGEPDRGIDGGPGVFLVDPRGDGDDESVIE